MFQFNRARKGSVVEILFLLIFLFMAIFIVGPLAIAQINGDNEARNYQKTLSKMEETLSKDFEDGDPKELLAFALKDAGLFDESYTVEEAMPFPQGNTVSYRLAENGDMIVALSPEPGIMCAARSVSGMVFGSCLSEESNPEAYKEPLTSIMDNPRTWDSESQPKHEKSKDEDRNIPFIFVPVV